MSSTGVEDGDVGIASLVSIVAVSDAGAERVATAWAVGSCAVGMATGLDAAGLTAGLEEDRVVILGGTGRVEEVDATGMAVGMMTLEVTWVA